LRITVMYIKTKLLWSSVQGLLTGVTLASECTLWTQLGEDIDGENKGDFSGSAVQLSYDGNIVAIGASSNDGGTSGGGHIRVFSYNDIDVAWTQLGDDIDGENYYEFFGDSIGLSADGTILAGGGFGFARVYKFNSGSWIQQGPDIDATGDLDCAGAAIALSADGTTVAIGAPYGEGDNYSYNGRVRVFTYNEGIFDWIQRGGDIYGEDDDNYSGKGLAMSGDGSIIAIGAIGSNYYTGHVRVYQFDGGTWVKLGQDIDGEYYYNYSGESIDLSADGYTVAVGGEGNSDAGYYAGHARIYTYSEDSNLWEQKGQDLDGEEECDESGTSVSLSADGSIVAVSAEWNDGNGIYSGHVRVFEFDNEIGGWVNVGDDIDGDSSGDNFGHEVSLSADGTTLASSADSDNGAGRYAGHVKILQQREDETLFELEIYSDSNASEETKIYLVLDLGDGNYRKLFSRPLPSNQLINRKQCVPKDKCFFFGIEDEGNGFNPTDEAYYKVSYDYELLAFSTFENSSMETVPFGNCSFFYY